MNDATILFRTNVTNADEQNVRSIVESTGFFCEEEVDIAVELVTERLQKAEASGYYFIFAESEGRTIGYTCFGPIPATRFSFDLYWIAVHNDFRGRGLGKVLLEESEGRIAELGGQNIYIETSSREQYHPTREFYRNCNYETATVLKDFYAPGDSKYIFVKVLPDRKL
jgi:ribosomal protein S18 acetylase RimI-like enzyme